MIRISKTFCSAILLACFLWAGAAVAQAPAKQFERGEELLYEAEFTRSVLRSVDVADFRFSATKVPLQSPADVPSPDSEPANKYSLLFNGEIKSKGFFSKLFNLNFLERVTSVVEPHSFEVQNTKRFDQQGKRVRASETIYDRAAGKVIWTEHDPRDPSREPRVASSPFTGQVQDILSAIYFLRAQPLELGKSFQITINDSGRVYDVPVRVVEKKRLKTVLGKIDTFRVDVDLFGAKGLVESNGQFQIWLSADERRVPVKARIKHEYGTFDIKLKKIVLNTNGTEPVK